MIRAAALFSGGKDSVYAAYIAQQQHFDLCKTLTIVPDRSDSYMFHVPNAGLASVVSGAMGLPNKTVEMSEGEDELESLGKAIGSLGVDAIITGAIASDYQMFRINLVCQPLGVKVFSPLWHKNQASLIREMVGAGFEIIMVGVSADGLDETWLGRRITNEAIDDLEKISARRRINISGEGGEFETMVLDGPNFVNRLEIVASSAKWKGSAGSLRIDALRSIAKR
jgi:diphthine-ammonia ligase